MWNKWQNGKQPRHSRIEILIEEKNVYKKTWVHLLFAGWFCATFYVVPGARVICQNNGLVVGSLDTPAWTTTLHPGYSTVSSSRIVTGDKLWLEPSRDSIILKWMLSGGFVWATYNVPGVKTITILNKNAMDIPLTMHHWSLWSCIEVGIWMNII